MIMKNCRSREGAWIEIKIRAEFNNDPRCRSREGAWIEMDMFDFYWPSFAVAPARERGLKLFGCLLLLPLGLLMSLPRGSVD